MTHAVFTIKAGSGYDDVPEERYHFPAQYLAKVRETVGDLIVYYEPRRGSGRLAYIAVAQVDRIDEDAAQGGHFYARMSGYLSFDAPVSFRAGDIPFESALRNAGRTGLSGDFRNAGRLLPQYEFETIVAAGFIQPVAATGTVESINLGELAEEPATFERPIVEQLVRRPFREAAFVRQVKTAYANRCAFTGLDMRNGGGRAEVDAAHIKPVGDCHNGPDSVRNGMALSKTVHWMFDRGLLSVDSNLKILSAGSLVPEPIKRLLRPDGYIIAPSNAAERPHPAFLEYHRNQIFKDARSGA